MSESLHTIDIDRIVLTDFGVTPDRAERILDLIELELQQLLVQQGLPDALAGSDVPHMTVPTMQLTEPRTDDQLAASVAESIAEALDGMKAEGNHAPV
jgi:hypothetical protein